MYRFYHDDEFLKIGPNDPLERIPKLINKVRNLPYEHKLRMDRWASDTTIGTEPNLCNTTGCLAGWATTIWPKEICLVDTGECITIADPNFLDITNFDEKNLLFASVLGITPQEAATIMYHTPANEDEDQRPEMIWILETLLDLCKKYEPSWERLDKFTTAIKNSPFRLE